MNTLILYIDNLRLMKNISQEEFVDGIISLRQYHRYISGKSNFPYHLFNAFSAKLNLDFNVILNNFDIDKTYEDNLIVDYYNYTIKNNISLALATREKLLSRHILNQQSRKLFDYTEIILKFKMGKISKLALMNNTMVLIDYPNILKVDVYNTYEFLMLSSLINFKEFQDKEKLYLKILSVINNDSVILSGKTNSPYLLSLYTLARYAGSKERYEESIQFGKMIIDYNSQNATILYEDFAYFFIAAGNYKLGRIDSYEKALLQLYYVLKIINDTDIFNSFVKSSKKFFNIDFETFILDIIKKANTD